MIKRMRKSRLDVPNYQIEIETIEVKPIDPKFMMFHNRDYWHLHP